MKDILQLWDWNFKIRTETKSPFACKISNQLDKCNIFKKNINQNEVYGERKD